MILLNIWELLDISMPLWINDGDDAEFYENGTKIPAYCMERTVRYITMDGEGVLTIELKEE